MTTLNKSLALAAALGLALGLPACTKSEVTVVEDLNGAPAADATFDKMLATEAIPTQDVADAAAEQEITEANADAEVEALKKEIDADG